MLLHFLMVACMLTCQFRINHTSNHVMCPPCMTVFLVRWFCFPALVEILCHHSLLYTVTVVSCMVPYSVLEWLFLHDCMLFFALFLIWWLTHCLRYLQTYIIFIFVWFLPQDLLFCRMYSSCTVVLCDIFNHCILFLLVSNFHWILTWTVSSVVLQEAEMQNVTWCSLWLC